MGAAMQQQAERFGAQTLMADVRMLDLKADPKKLVTSEGTFLSKTVVIATGASARELGLPEEKSLLLQHLVLSHHGEPEFGAAVRPQCPEAELLSSIDLIDSRMEIYAEALQDVPEGAFSPRVFALDRRVYHHK